MPSCVRPYEPGLNSFRSQMKAKDPKPSLGSSPPSKEQPGRSRSEAVCPAAPHGLRAEEKNGATPRSLAPDAYDCIMVKVTTTPEYKAVEELAPPPLASSLRSLRRRISLPTGRRCRILGDRSAPACGQTRMPTPSNQRGPPPNLFPLTTNAPYKGRARSSLLFLAPLKYPKGSIEISQHPRSSLTFPLGVSDQACRAARRRTGSAQRR